MDWLAVLSRWTHVGTAIVIVGGTFFLQFVLSPATNQLSAPQQSQFKSLVLARWKKFIHLGILLFLVSGVYNYLVVSAPLHKGDRQYHALIGTKVLVAFGMFFIASSLVGRSHVSEGMRNRSTFWHSAILLLAAVIICISGYAKVAMKPTTRTAVMDSEIRAVHGCV